MNRIDRDLEDRVRADWRGLTKRLIALGWTVSTMESATGGQIASLITDTEGSSAVLKGAFVTYSNEAKVMQGVPREVIERYSVYSAETAAAMAEACARAYNADVGIGVTGTMGNPDPANPGVSVPGEVWFAICAGERTDTYHISLEPLASRLSYKLRVAEEIGRALKTLPEISGRAV